MAAAGGTGCQHGVYTAGGTCVAMSKPLLMREAMFNALVLWKFVTTLMQHKSCNI